MSYGLVLYDAGGVVRFRLGNLSDDIGKLIEIPGWPTYKVRSTDLQVVSFHSKENGYELKRLKANRLYDRNEDGFNLYYKGKRGFIGESELRKIVEVHKQGNKMSHFASSRGGLKTGDLIIGSVSKNSKTVSFASDPMVQDSLANAKVEAARLATIDKTKKFVIVEVKAVASVTDVVWE